MILAAAITSCTDTEDREKINSGSDGIEHAIHELWSTGDFLSAARALHDDWQSDQTSETAAVYVCDFWTALEDTDRAKSWCGYATDVSINPGQNLYAKIVLANMVDDSEYLNSITIEELAALTHSDSIYPAIRIMRDARIRLRDYAAARELYESLYPQLIADQPSVTTANALAAIDYALLMVNAGKFDRAKNLLSQAESIIEQVEPNGSFGFSQVEIAAIRGKNELAIHSLQELLNENVRWMWWYLEENENLVTLHNDNRFVIMLNMLRADLQRQRRRIVDQGLLLSPGQDIPAAN